MAVADNLEALARFTAAGDPRLAARLFGAAEAERERLAHSLNAPWQRLRQVALVRLRSGLAPAALADAWTAGRLAALDTVLAEALALDVARFGTGGPRVRTEGLPA